MKDKRSKSKARTTSGTYAALPHVVMDSQDFRGLSNSTYKVLLMLYREYNGKNNGDLSATFNQAKTWGIGSEQTLSNALKELMRANLILKTREGVFMNPGGKCCLYAVTWQAIDDCKGKLDISATIAPPRKFSLEHIIKTPSTEIVATQYDKRSHEQEISLD